MKNLRHLFRRSGLLSTQKRRRRSENPRRSDATQRRLTNEVLEKRELLAGDILASGIHNYWNRYDVNDDGQISARDALGVINYMNSSGEGEAANPDGPKMYYDVNADSNITAADALGVINAMSRGEEVGELVELLLTARDLNDQPIVADGNGEINVDVGQRFDLEVSYDDLRLFNERLGVFQLFTDISVSQSGVLSPVLNETQRLIIDSTLTSVPSTGLTFMIPESPPGISGGALTYESSINDFGNNASGEVANALTTFGYTASQFEVSSLDFGNNDIGFQIHWVGDEFGNVNLPNISVEVNETNPADDIPTQTVEFAPFLADGVTPNTDAVRFNINSFSRTFNNNEEFYSAQNRGDFDAATGFAGVGGLGMVPLEGGGIPQLTDDGGFIEPFDAFSLRVFLNQPVTDLVIGVNPGEDPEATLLYGRDDAVPQDMVLIENVDSNSNGIASITINAGEVVTQPGTLSISPATLSVTEGDTGTTTATFTVSRASGSDGIVSVDFATADGTATAGSDYVLTSGTVTFADGDTADKTITVPVNGDTVDENDETFTVTLSSPTGGAMLGTAVSTVTIIDDDVTLAPGVLSISPATLSVTEGDAGTTTATFTVSRASGSDGAVSVNFATADGTATAGSDYTANSGTVTFADGDTADKTITVSVIGDTLDEANETFTVTLSSPTGGATLGTAVSTATIIDDDDAAPVPGVLSISPATLSVTEGNSGTTTATFTVSRAGGSDGAVSVNFATANGTATAGSDYTANSGTVTFADGDTAAKTITVSVIGDTFDEPDETFTVTLSSPTGGATLGTAVSTATIIDDDLPGDVPGSKIGGSIFIDHVENLSDIILSNADPIRNGIKDSDESGLGGVPVRLVSAAGQNSTGQAVNLTAFTELDGSYCFEGVAPGNYSVVYDVDHSTVIFLGASEIPVTIGSAGGQTLEGLNFALLGTQGSALDTVDILATSYLRTNPPMSQLSDGGREGGLVSLDANGNQNFFIANEGFEGIRFAELVLNDARDAALLTVIEDDGDVLTARLSGEHFVVTADGMGVQFFGGIDDFVFTDADTLSIEDEFANYRKAIDQVLAGL